VDPWALYAAAALGEIVHNELERHPQRAFSDDVVGSCSEQAARFADAMIAERNKRED
jgi:hypothetical protein